MGMNPSANDRRKHRKSQAFAALFPSPPGRGPAHVLMPGVRASPANLHPVNLSLRSRLAAVPCATGCTPPVPRSPRAQKFQTATPRPPRLLIFHFTFFIFNSARQYPTTPSRVARAPYSLIPTPYSVLPTPYSPLPSLPYPLPQILRQFQLPAHAQNTPRPLLHALRPLVLIRRFAAHALAQLHRQLVPLRIFPQHRILKLRWRHAIVQQTAAIKARVIGESQFDRKRRVAEIPESPLGLQPRPEVMIKLRKRRDAPLLVAGFVPLPSKMRPQVLPQFLPDS